MPACSTTRLTSAFVAALAPAPPGHRYRVAACAAMALHSSRAGPTGPTGPPGPPLTGAGPRELDRARPSGLGRGGHAPRLGARAPADRDGARQSRGATERRLRHELTELDLTARQQRVPAPPPARLRARRLREREAG